MTQPSPPPVARMGQTEFIALIAMLSLVVSGCASRAPAVGTGADFWSGRLALQVEGRDAQSFSALFELRGDDQRGSPASVRDGASRSARQVM